MEEKDKYPTRFSVKQIQEFTDKLIDYGFHKWSRPYSNFGTRYAFKQGDIIVFFNVVEDGITRNINYSFNDNRNRTTTYTYCTIPEIMNLHTIDDIITYLKDVEDSVGSTKYPKVDWDKVKELKSENADKTEEEIDNQFNVDAMLSKYEWVN